MQLINEFLHKHLYKGVLVYLNDTLIYIETSEEHMKLVRGVLRKRQEAQLYTNLSKCEFHKICLDYLGFWISNEILEIDFSNPVSPNLYLYIYLTFTLDF